MSDGEHDVGGDARGPTRKRRARLNCAECRRLKLKCDRKVPCDNCSKRKCQEICPDGARDAVRKTAASVRARMAGDDAHSNDTINTSSGSDTARRSAERSGRISSPRDRSQSPSRRRPFTQNPSLATSDGVFGQPAQSQAEGPGASASATGSGLVQQSDASAASGLDLFAGYSGTINSSKTQIAQQSPFTQSFSRTTTTSQGTSSNRVVFVNQSGSPNNQSHGTLVISHTGRSKYLGPSAASEWLKDQEVEDSHETPAVSRPASPAPAGATAIHHPKTGSFNFLGSGSTPSSMSSMLSLPNPDEAEVLIDSYYRYFGWSYDIVPRKKLQAIFDKVYDVLTGGRLDRSSRRAHAQKLALSFAVLAMGALHNLESPPDDHSAEEYVSLARDASEAGDFVVHNTIAGVQTLSVMAHYHSETEKGRNGDSAWPLWGLAMRIIQAMGSHRDGQRWNLPDELVEERRKVFWETHSAEIFQANCFSRPCSLPAEFIDTKFPTRQPRLGETDGRDYGTLKFQSCQISKDILYSALTVNPTTPSPSPDSLYQRICTFEREMPYASRCRAALLALPSLYSDPSQAEADSPEPNKRDLKRCFEQHHLASMISENVINLYRSYFMRALNEDSIDPLRSQYGQPFLSVVERSNVIIHIVCESFSMFPSVTSRHWWCWYHAFNSAVNLGTSILMSPHNGLTPVASASMDKVIGLYTSVVQIRGGPRFVQNLQWLLRLRQRAVDRMSSQNHNSDRPGTETNGEGGDAEAELDAGSLGWRTRFIERATVGGTKATTISAQNPSVPDQSPLEIDSVIQSLPQAVQDHIFSADGGGPDPGSTSNQSNATDYFLHDFWDPLMMLQADMAPDGGQGLSTNWGEFLS